MADRQKFNFGRPMVSQTNVKANEEVNVPEHLEKLRSIDQKEKRIFDIKYIPRSKIRENKKNHYPQDQVEKLKDSILHFGLQQNLTVVYLEEKDIYVLEAGHTRTRAIDDLIKEFENYPNKEDEYYKLYQLNIEEYKLKGYPCKVSSVIKDGTAYDYTEDTDLADIPEDVIDSEIRLIITNEMSRDRSPATTAANVDRLHKLYQRKNIGKKKQEKINVANQIAEDLNLKKRQVMNYTSLQNLIPELRKEFESNNITLTESTNYAKLSHEEQKTLLQLLESGSKVSKSELEALIKEKKALQEKLDDQQDKICRLEKQVTIYNADELLLIKADLAAKAAYDAVQKAISNYQQSILPILNNDNRDLEILTADDISDQITELKNQLNILADNMR